jgi:hypothetical protein
MRRREWLALASGAVGRSVWAAETFQPLFNGRNLDEWIVDTPGLWRVEDVGITGVSPGLKYNDFLRTRKHYRNFILRTRFQMVSESDRANSGIQFRSKPVPDSHEVSGYQADVGQQYWGCLYDESRRNRILAQARPEALAKLDKAGWNEYEIHAEGRRIVLKLNGIVSVDYTEPEDGIDETGFIALQLHGGPPMTMHFRELMIRELP